MSRADANDSSSSSNSSSSSTTTSCSDTSDSDCSSSSSDDDLTPGSIIILENSINRRKNMSKHLDGAYNITSNSSNSEKNYKINGKQIFSSSSEGIQSVTQRSEYLNAMRNRTR